MSVIAAVASIEAKAVRNARLALCLAALKGAVAT